MALVTLTSDAAAGRRLLARLRDIQAAIACRDGCGRQPFDAALNSGHAAGVVVSCCADGATNDQPGT